jgi:hypothetical protein
MVTLVRIMEEINGQLNHTVVGRVTGMDRNYGLVSVVHCYTS